jgi:hypothetical protein
MHRERLSEGPSLACFSDPSEHLADDECAMRDSTSQELAGTSATIHELSASVDYRANHLD